MRKCYPVKRQVDMEERVSALVAHMMTRDKYGRVPTDITALENVAAQFVNGSREQRYNEGKYALDAFITDPDLGYRMGELKTPKGNSFRTHSSMVGGRFPVLTVPCSEMHQFRDNMGALLRDGSLMYLTEFLGERVRSVDGIWSLNQRPDAICNLVIDFDKCRLPFNECVYAAAELSKLLKMCLRNSHDVESDTRIAVAMPHWMVDDSSTDVKPYTGKSSSLPLYYVKNMHTGGNCHLHGPPLRRAETQLLAGKLGEIMLQDPKFPVFQKSMEELQTKYSIKNDELLRALAFSAGKNSELNVIDHNISGCRLPFVPKAAASKTELVPVCYAPVCVTYIKDGDVEIDNRAHTGCIDPSTRRVATGNWRTAMLMCSVQVEPGTLSVVDEDRLKQVTSLRIKLPRTILYMQTEKGEGGGGGGGIKRKYGDDVKPDLQARGSGELKQFVFNVSASIRAKKQGCVPPFLRQDINNLERANFATSLFSEVEALVSKTHLRVTGTQPASPFLRSIYIPTKVEKGRPRMVITLSTEIPKACMFKKNERGNMGAIHKSNHQRVLVSYKKNGWHAHMQCHDSDCATRARTNSFTIDTSVLLSEEAVKDIVNLLKYEYGIDVVDPQDDLRRNLSITKDKQERLQILMRLRPSVQKD